MSASPLFAFALGLITWGAVRLAGVRIWLVLVIAGFGFQLARIF